MAERTCRVCGCTDNDCRQCVEAQGEPCHWVAADLCSRCISEKGPRHGEYIPLFWDMGPDYEFIRGHVTLEEAQKAIRDNDLEFLADQMRTEDLEYMWARFEVAPPGLECNQYLREYDKQGQGCFPVTRIEHYERS